MTVRVTGLRGLVRATKVKSKTSLSAGGASGTITIAPDSTSVSGSTLARRLKHSPASSVKVAATDAACSNCLSRPPEISSCVGTQTPVALEMVEVFVHDKNQRFLQCA